MKGAYDKNQGDDGEVPDEILKDMIDKSHQLILNDLPEKIQKEILEKE